MKNLMRQGHHHHHNHSHSINHHFSHAHVYTLAGNPPNVVDLTASSKALAADNNNNESKRPWSRRSRALRNATIRDITAHGTIRAAGVADGIGGTMELQHDRNGKAAGFRRLWRGVQTMFVGCIPAHALYFSSYEAIKSACTDNNRRGGGQQQHEQHNNIRTTGTTTTAPITLVTTRCRRGRPCWPGAWPPCCMTSS